MHRLTWTLLGLLLTSAVLAQDPPQPPASRGQKVDGKRRGSGAAPANPAEAQKAAPDADGLPAGAVARLGAAPRSARPGYVTARGSGSPIVFSPDGRLLAFADTEVRLRDAATGR